MLLSIITSLHICICVLLIVLVLLQQGKGADAGVTFGGGGNTVFGASGADNFITRFTTVLACCFMVTSVYLGVKAKPESPSEGRLFKGVANSAPVVVAESSSSDASNSSNTSSENQNPEAAVAAAVASSEQNLSNSSASESSASSETPNAK